jgi:hypothetical protein
MAKCFRKIITAVFTLAIIFALAATTSQSFVASAHSSFEDCPEIKVDCPVEQPEEGTTYVVTARLEGADVSRKLIYRWSIYGGKIIKGQGTPSVMVRIKHLWMTTTVTVKIGGLKAKCRKMGSCSFTVS